MVRRTKWKKENEPYTHQTMVVRKIGNWDIGFIQYGRDPKTFLMVRGLEYGENPIIYSHNMQVAYDRPGRIPKSVTTWLQKNSVEMFKLQQQLNKEMGSSYLQ